MASCSQSTSRSFYTRSLLSHLLSLTPQKLLGSWPGTSYTERRPYDLSLKDVKEAFPEVGKNLQALLDYPGEDVEDLFGFTFQVSYQSFGQTVDVVCSRTAVKSP